MTPGENETHRYGVVVLLMLAYTLNSADRSLIAVIGQPLKLDLALTDTQLGFLIGTAFAALYAFSGIPIARLAERFNRVNILFVVITLWSLLTALCGFAANFIQLMWLRIGVGVGEAGCTPPAHSLISDYFGPERRATAISIYSCGISLGYILSALGGGWLALHYGWRAACIGVGLPGVAVALLIRLLIQEPRRSEGAAHAAAHEASAARAGGRGILGDEVGALGRVARSLCGRWPVLNVLIGVTLSTFAAQGSWAFMPAFYNRDFGLDYARTGLLVGITGGIPVGLGLLLGGTLTDALGRTRTAWYALLPCVALLACVPLYLLACGAFDWSSSALALGVAGMLQYLSFGPTFGIVQNVVEPRQRATAVALIYVVMNVLALGGGAPFTGWIIDVLAAHHHAHPAAHALGDALHALLHGTPGAHDTFLARCGSAALAQDCHAALALATREGIMLTVLLHAWAAVHYGLGAIGLSRVLRFE